MERLAVWLTISPGLAVAKEVEFEGDGKPLLKATLEAKKGRQELPLPARATFSRVEADGPFGVSRPERMGLDQRNRRTRRGRQ